MKVFALLPILFINALLGFAQTISLKDNPETFDVATWNIEWFGASNGPTNDALQVENVKQIIQQSGLDLWAVQEIADPTDFNTLLASLGSEYAGALATVLQSGVTQRIGFLYKPASIQVEEISHILESDMYYFGGRPPLQLRGKIQVNGEEETVYFITLHAKASSDTASHDRRQVASGLLKSYIESLPNDAQVMVLGDLNDLLNGSITTGQESPYKNFIDDPTHFTFLTTTIGCTYIGFNPCSTIDHILVTDDLATHYVANSVQSIQTLPTEVNDYANTTSDHLPVVAQIHQVTGTFSETNVPEYAFINARYPNPFQSTLTIQYQLNEVSQHSLVVYDVLGRKVTTLFDGIKNTGIHEIHWAGIDETSNVLSPGMYFIRLITPHKQQTFSVIFSTH